MRTVHDAITLSRAPPEHSETRFVKEGQQSAHDVGEVSAMVGIVDGGGSGGRSIAHAVSSDGCVLVAGEDVEDGAGPTGRGATPPGPTRTEGRLFLRRGATG